MSRLQENHAPYEPVQPRKNNPKRTRDGDAPGPTFGVPCPTAILSIGLLLAAPGVVPTHPCDRPAALSMVGGSAAIMLWRDDRGGAPWNPSTIHGNPARGTGILNNELYAGRLVWNRLRYVKDPDIIFKADHNQFVRRLLAAVMLVLFASLNAMDGVCCPDGCTHEEQSPAQQHNPESTDGICVLCLGGVDSSASQDLSPCGIVMDRVGLLPFAHHLDVPPDPVEHPPRS